MMAEESRIWLLSYFGSREVKYYQPIMGDRTLLIVIFSEYQGSL
jgi:hypothetical protein